MLQGYLLRLILTFSLQVKKAATYSLLPQKSVLPTFLESQTCSTFIKFSQKINNIYQTKKLYDENMFHH
jgi:hypothetical protein